MSRWVSCGMSGLLPLSRDTGKMAALTAENFEALQSLLKVSCRVGTSTAATLSLGLCGNQELGINLPWLGALLPPVLVCVTLRKSLSLSELLNRSNKINHSLIFEGGSVKSSQWMWMHPRISDYEWFSRLEKPGPSAHSSEKFPPFHQPSPWLCVWILPTEVQFCTALACVGPGRFPDLLW